MPHRVTTLPDHYRETLHLNVADDGTLEKLSALSLWGLGISVVVCLAWILLVRQILSPPAGEGSPHFLLGIISVLGVLLLHEWIHGVVIRLTGHVPRYGAKWVNINRHIRVPYLLYATTDTAYFSRSQFIAIALAPLIVITLLGFGLIALLPYGYSLTITIALIINGSGSVGDLWMAWLVAKSHPDALIKDEADAIRIFEPVN